VAVPTVVQLDRPAGERWYVTEPRPDPPVSAEDPVSVIVPRMYAPGSATSAVGGAASTLATEALS
jgi:hypothetical protein